MSSPKSPPAPESATPDGYGLQIIYTSSLHTPPEHTVTVRTSQSEWADVSLTWSGEAWRGELRSTEEDGPIDVEFKFVLNSEHWMTGRNQHARTQRPDAVLSYDDSSVQFDQ